MFLGHVLSSPQLPYWLSLTLVQAWKTLGNSDP